MSLVTNRELCISLLSDSEVSDSTPLIQVPSLLQNNALCFLNVFKLKLWSQWGHNSRGADLDLFLEDCFTLDTSNWSIACTTMNLRKQQLMFESIHTTPITYRSKSWTLDWTVDWTLDWNLDWREYQIFPFLWPVQKWQIIQEIQLARPVLFILASYILS